MRDPAERRQDLCPGNGHCNSRKQDPGRDVWLSFLFIDPLSQTSC
jgi:hypothetical protein